MSSANQPWIWLDPQTLIAVHEAQLAEHGGAVGTRDIGLFESALAKPQHLVAYGEPGAASLAAAYGAGIARNHPFIDGNKRTAFVAVELFLMLNGFLLTADDANCVMVMLGVASGDIDEAAFATWLREHTSTR